MRISKLVTRLVERDMGGRLWNPKTRWSRKQILLAFVESADGHVGVGEAWVSGGSAEVVRCAIEDDIAPRVIGADAFHVERLWATVFAAAENSGRRGVMGAALGAVDAAIWDLLGKVLGVPLYRLLGAHSERVPVYASAGLYGEGKSTQDLGDEMADYVAKGFTAVKMKVGGLSLAEDVARVATAREAIGPDTKLMVDAVYNYNVPGALRFARAVERYDVHFFEAPVSPYDIPGQARVNREQPIPVCGNETEYGRDRFRDLIVADAVDYVQFDIAACAGISEGRRIAHLAAAFNRPVTLHAASSAVLFAGTLHLAATLANCESVEYHMVHQWLFDLAAPDAFVLEDGHVRPPAGPGIGLEIHYDSIEDAVAA